MNDFVFYPETHTYKLNGIPIPSVTTIIKDVIRWEDLSFGYFKEKTTDAEKKAYMKFGVSVHKACELYIKGSLSVEKMDPLLLPALEGFKKFIETTKFEVIESEVSHYNEEFMYAGTLDLYGVLNGKKTVIDIKTGKHYKNYPLQTAAYALLIDKDAERYSLMLDRDNPTFELKKHDKKADFIYWENVINVYHGKKRYGGSYERKLISPYGDSYERKLVQEESKEAGGH